MSGFVMSIDAGTTSTKTIIIDPDVTIRARATCDLEQFFPQPGWVEHDPEEIWRSVLTTMRSALSQAGLRASELAAVGITNQRETVVVWDRRTGHPLHHALGWQDRRTASVCDSLERDGAGPWVQERTGLRLDPYFSATKIAWILDHVPGLRERARRGEVCAGTVDSWILWRLSAGRIHATDVTNASRTSLMDLRSGVWDEELCNLFDVPVEMLASIRPSECDFAESDAEILDGSARIAGILGDQQAALLGQGCRRAGQTKNTYGTGSFVLQHTGERVPHDTGALIATAAASREDEARQFAIEGSIFVTGAAISWLRDALGIIGATGESEALASSLADNGDVWFVPAMTGLGAPHWDPYARGTILGITRGTTRAHLARAALESIAYQTRDVIDEMNRHSPAVVSELRVDGGATENQWLMQFQCDVLGVDVVVAAHADATALGAAFAAGRHSRVWSRHEDLETRGPRARRFRPAMSAEHRDELYARWRQALERSRQWSDASRPD